MVRNLSWIAGFSTAVALLLTGCGDDGGGTQPPTAPTILTHPSSQVVTEGQTATFTVVATGSGTLTYQWKKNGSNVVGGTGGTNASYTTPASALADDGAQFICAIANAVGNVTSNTATLTVNMAPPTIFAHPSNQAVTEGQTAAFVILASGSGTLTYQWRKVGVDIAGATGNSLVIGATAYAHNGALFDCVVTNAAGSTPSNAAVLTVDMLSPAITTHPTNLTVTEGEDATFTVEQRVPARCPISGRSMWLRFGRTSPAKPLNRS